MKKVSLSQQQCEVITTRISTRRLALPQTVMLVDRHYRLALPYVLILTDHSEPGTPQKDLSGDEKSL